MKEISVEGQDWITAKGYKKNVLLTSEDLCNEGSLVQLVIIEAGEMIADHYHQTSFEFYYVIEGKCRLVVNGENIFLGTGSALLMEPGDIHSLFNEGQDRFLLLVYKSNSGKGDIFWDV